jgi:hypothetical protein
MDLKGMSSSPAGTLIFTTAAAMFLIEIYAYPVRV